MPLIVQHVGNGQFPVEFHVQAGYDRKGKLQSIEESLSSSNISLKQFRYPMPQDHIKTLIELIISKSPDLVFLEGGTPDHTQQYRKESEQLRYYSGERGAYFWNAIYRFVDPTDSSDSTRTK